MSKITQAYYYIKYNMTLDLEKNLKWTNQKNNITPCMRLMRRFEKQFSWH